MLFWWARRDSNPQPRDYESPALTVELQALIFCNSFILFLLYRLLAKYSECGLFRWSELRFQHGFYGSFGKLKELHHRRMLQSIEHSGK